MHKSLDSRCKPILNPALRRNMWIVIIAAALSACGGGGSGGTAAPLTPTPTPVDNIPSAVADNLATNQNTPLTANLQANDTGLEDSPVVYSLDSPANNGSVSLS